MESYQKLHKDCSRTIEQDAPIGISKQHTNLKQKLKNSKTIWNIKINNEENKKNSKWKWPRTTHLWRTYAHDTKWWHSHGALLGCCENGAEAMDWNGQDPPRSCGDLEGAWWVWKKGGSASPSIDGEDED